MDLFPLVLFFIQAMLRFSTLVLPSKQRLHNLRILPKVGFQKPCWDQARLSSLVNKQVDVVRIYASVFYDKTVFQISLWAQIDPFSGEYKFSPWGGLGSLPVRPHLAQGPEVTADVCSFLEEFPESGISTNPGAEESAVYHQGSKSRR